MITLTVAIIILLAIAAYFVFTKKSTPTPLPSPTPTNLPTETPEPTPVVTPTVTVDPYISHSIVLRSTGVTGDVVNYGYTVDGSPVNISHIVTYNESTYGANTPIRVACGYMWWVTGNASWEIGPKCS